ncbi:MAG TPA: hypothetical protein VGU46_08225 [Acidobacteriaceae bacterium]|nr:hypothetical protein [Acidobacteriaceae bacterium]
MPIQPANVRPQRRALDIACQWLPFALATISAGFILLFLYTALRRMNYPFAFDQVEGSMVTSVWRVAHGMPLYTAPTQDFVPFLYAPLYFYIAAAVGKLVGIGYGCLRLVSILGTLGSCGVIYALIHGETRSRLGAIAGAGLYAACFSQLGGWFDYGRVDSLFVFLLLLAIYCTRRAPVLVAVLVWLVAFQTKQTILPVAVLVLCAEWQRPRRMIFGLVALIAGFAGSIVMMNHLTGGWYSYYLFGTAKGLPWLMRTAVLYLPSDLLQPFGLAFLIVLASLLWVPVQRRSRSTQFYLIVSFSLYASIWFLRAHAGSSSNTLIPVYAWTAVLFGIALARLMPRVGGMDSPQQKLCSTLLLGAACVQILGFLYHPGRYDPGAYAVEGRQKFEQQLSAIPGDVYVINHSYDAMLAGKQPHAVIDAFGIIQDSPPSAMRTAYLAAFHRAIDAHAYSAFVLDDTADTYKPGDGWMPADFADQYPVRLLAESASISGPGAPPVEKWIYLPCSALDGDTSGFIHAGSAISYGTCPKTPQK